MIVQEISMRTARTASEGQQSVSVSTSSAATTNPLGADTYIIYSTVECFAVAGTTPTATVAAGTPVPAETLLRMTCEKTDKIALISASGTGTAYIRPGA